MPSPPIQVFLTTIASQPALRQRQEYLLRILQVKKITFTSYDLASDEQAKRLWRRKAPLDKQQLPGILIGGRFPGTFTDFENAVEFGELDIFLRLTESYDAAIEEDRPAPVVQPVGVPGAAEPLQMTPEHLRTKILATTPSPLRGKDKPAGVPVNKRVGEFDVSTELVGFGLQGVKVTHDELAELVAELGLDGEEAGDLVKGLSGEGDEADGKKEPLREEAKASTEVVAEKVADSKASDLQEGKEKTEDTTELSTKDAVDSKASNLQEGVVQSEEKTEDIPKE